MTRSERSAIIRSAVVHPVQKFDRFDEAEEANKAYGIVEVGKVDKIDEVGEAVKFDEVHQPASQHVRRCPQGRRSQRG